MVRRSARLSAGHDEISTPVCESSAGSKSFRFVDLPPELRNRIYSFTFSESPKARYNLATLRDPAVALVSRQLRNESLPIFFSECHFVITVGGNYFQAHAWREAGNLGLQRTKIPKMVGKDLVFRHVTFRVWNYTQATNVRKALEVNDWYEAQQLADFEVQTHPQLAVTAKNDVQLHWWYNTTARVVITAQIDLTLNTAEQVTKDMPKREGFKGLTLRDLDKIAKCFRLKMNSATGKMECG